MERKKAMNNELFMCKPSLSQMYGRTVTFDTEFDEKTDSGEVHQILKHCVLITEINKEWEHNGVKNVLHSVQTETLPEGTVIVWSEEYGYIVPNVPVYKLRDLEEEIKLIKEAYADNTDIGGVGKSVSS